MTDALTHDIATLPGVDVRNNVISYMEAHVARFPQRTALRWAEGASIAGWDGSIDTPFDCSEVSYAELEHLIAATAKRLQDLGIQQGDRVIIFLPMSLWMYTAMFAVMRIGAVSVFLDSWARRSHLAVSAACVTPTAMISHRAAFDLIETVPEFETCTLRIIGGPGASEKHTARLEELMRPGPRAEVAPVAADDPALITFTTGSSGTPKGANRTHRFLASQHRALGRVIPYVPEDRDLPAFPIFSLNNLAEGVTTILPALNLAAPADTDAASLVKQILHDPISCTTLSPSMLNGVSGWCLAKGVTMPSLRRVITGGAPISRDNVADFAKVAPNAEIWVLYGSTEAEPMAHIEAQDFLSLPLNPDPEIVEEGVNVGHIVDELDYRFVRAHSGPISLANTPWSELLVPEGGIGELIVAGDHVCRDYYNNPEAFQRAKIADGDTVWHRTGDLARLDADGYLYIVGRVHNAVERAGTYHFPVRAEVLLKRIDGLQRGAFLGLDDAELGQRCVVAVQLADGTDAKAALAEVARLFAKNDLPLDGFFVVDEVPMDPRHHSKVEYGELRQHLLDAAVPDLLG